MRNFLFLLGALLALPLALACPVTLAAQNTDAFLTELPVLDEALRSCSTTITPPGDRLVGEGGFTLAIMRADGSETNVYVTTEDKRITGISSATSETRWTVTMSEETLDRILSASSRGDATAQEYGSRAMSVRANTFLRATGWFFVQPFVRRAVNKAVAE